MLTCLFCRFTQTALKLAGEEKWHHIKSLFYGLGVQDIAAFDSN
jgi:hypothetical protein